jgi:hypothetical protein
MGLADRKTLVLPETPVIRPDEIQSSGTHNAGRLACGAKSKR